MCFTYLAAEYPLAAFRKCGRDAKGTKTPVRQTVPAPQSIIECITGDSVDVRGHFLMADLGLH